MSNHSTIGATTSVPYREVVRSWEGPLWEVPLYIQYVKNGTLNAY